MSKALVINANKSDLRELYALEQLCFGADAFSRRQLSYLLSSANVEFILTRDGGEISAYMILLKKKNSFGLRLYSLAVSPRHRGKGLGKLLLDASLKRGKELGLRYLNLEVNENNSTAVKLYLQEGFEVFGERLDYYKDGSKALLMKKAVL